MPRPRRQTPPDRYEIPPRPSHAKRNASADRPAGRERLSHGGTQGIGADVPSHRLILAATHESQRSFENGQHYGNLTSKTPEAHRGQRAGRR